MRGFTYGSMVLSWSLAVGLSGLIATEVVAGPASADFNVDLQVNLEDYDTFLQNYAASGPSVTFGQGDANGDQHVRLFCDLAPIVEQFGGGLTSGSTMVPTASYNPTTGDLTIDNSTATGGRAYTALYLANTAGTTLSTVSIGPTGFGVLEVNNGAFPVPGFATGSTSLVVNQFAPGSDPLGATGLPIVWNATANQSVADLHLYFQRSGQPVMPVTVTDTVSQLTHTAALGPDGFCPCIPEPGAAGVLVGMGAVLFGRVRRR